MTGTSDQGNKPHRIDHYGAVAAGFILGMAAIGLVTWTGSDAEWTWEYWGGSDPDRSAVLRNFALIAAGIVGLGLGGWRAWTAYQQAAAANKQVRIAIRGQQVDRYQKGAQMLESAELSVRIAGIFALRELAFSDPEETYILVQSLLCGFIREKSRMRKKLSDHTKPAESSSLDDEITDTNEWREYERLSPDIVEAITAFDALRKKIPDSASMESGDNWRPILAEANLSEEHIGGIDFRNAVLRSANLSKSVFYEGRFPGASLIRADLSNGVFVSADFTGAALQKALLREAEFSEANFSRCQFGGTIISAPSQFDFAWAWADTPPKSLPENINFDDKLFDPGLSGANRKAYEAGVKTGELPPTCPHKNLRVKPTK